jgi:hypothetical protein
VLPLSIHSAVHVSVNEKRNEEIKHAHFCFSTVGTDSCVSSTQGCRPSVRRWGALTLSGLTGVIIGSVCGYCLLVALIVFICKKLC